MSFPIKVTAAAAEDLEDAAIWYEDQVQGLGQKFLQAVRNGFKTIKENPNRYPYADAQKVRRRYLLPSPFRSYLIIYIVEKQSVIVTAVFHTSRDPNVWQSRN